MHWQNSVDFFNQNESFWPDSKDNANSSYIHWKFTRYQNHYSSFPIYQCEMEGWGEHTIGYCYSDNHFASAQKSFAEAWERLWFQKYSRNGNLISSSGFAAGETAAMALQKSRQELIERQVLLEAWANQSGWNLITVKSIKNKFLTFGMRLLGWQLTIFNIQSNIGVVKVGLMRHQKYGAYLDTTFCDNEFEAERKVIFSLFKYFLTFKNDKFFLNTTDFSSPEDHLRFYSNPKNLKAFDFLDQLDISQTNSLYILGSEEIQSELLVDAGDFPAVAYSHNPNWKKFCWGKQSIQGINPWPQPLA